MKVSICTPTYNRAHCLDRLYNSLVNQTSKDFEWIIIDDGSNDKTKEKVEYFINQKKIVVKYFYKNNGGKHTAIKEALNYATGEYFFIVDSDDFLKCCAVAAIIEKFNGISTNFAGIAFMKEFENGNLVGTTFKGDYLDATSLERSKFKIHGDKAEVFFTQILKKYPFPAFDNEKFLTEAIIWNRIANDGYKIRWFNESIYVCQYQNDGLSMSVNYLNSFDGYTLFIKELLSYKTTCWIDKVKYTGVYANNAKKLNIKDHTSCKTIGCSILFYKFCRLLYSVKKIIKKDNREKELNIK